MTFCYGEGYGESFRCGFALRFGLRVEIRELQDANLTLSSLNGLRVGIEGGRQNGLRVATDQTGGRRQTVLETLHSKLEFTLHITQFPHC